MNFNSFNDFFSYVALEEFQRLGGEHVFIAPGSRSTPLVLAAHKNKKLKKHVHFDERGLGFYALGCARFTQKPVMVITTSGTAVANLYPAVIEAFYSHIPLIICSADRPFELRDSGANQAIDQNQIFGKYVRFFSDIPSPNATTPIESLLTTMDTSFYKSSQLQPGPVHLNWMFQEPLVPPKVSEFHFAPSKKFQDWLNSSAPYTQYSRNTISAEINTDLISTAQNGLVVLGSQISEFAAVKELIDLLQWPVLPDIQSGFRFSSNIISHCDLILEIKKDLSPDVILQIGGAPTSKNLTQFLKNTSAQIVQVTSSTERMDPLHLPKTVLHATVAKLNAHIKNVQSAKDLFVWKTLENKTEKFLNSYFESPENLTEPYVAFALSKFISQAECNLYLSSSRPVRDMDRYGSCTETKIHTFSNRGTSGIDGNLATLAGTALASNRRTYALIGDLAALHDLNSLALLEKTESPITIVLINNNGGGIFSFLPVAQEQEAFEKYFGMPHNQNFEKLLSGFDTNFFKAHSPKQFFDALEMAEHSPLCSIIEIETNRAENYTFHKKLLQDFQKSEA